jgi:PKD repeat protein
MNTLISTNLMVGSTLIITTANATTVNGFGWISANAWDFGDGTTSTNTHIYGKTYAAIGTYTVTLTATMSPGGCTSVATQIVNVTAPTAATFTTTPNTCGSKVVGFTSTSTGATSYSWDFGDMTNSSAAAPIHAYAANGSYTVTLTAINGNCSDVTTFNVNIAVSLDELPGVALSLVPNPATTSFNVALTGASLELVTVIDAFGRTILNSTEATINLNQVANGMYNVVVSTNKGTSVRKLIVNN